MLLSLEKWVTSPRPITLQPETPAMEAEPSCHRLVREEFGWICGDSGAVTWHPGADKWGARAHNMMAEPSSRGCVMLSRVLDLGLPWVDQRWPLHTAEKTWLASATRVRGSESLQRTRTHRAEAVLGGHDRSGQGTRGLHSSPDVLPEKGSVILVSSSVK